MKRKLIMQIVGIFIIVNLCGCTITPRVIDNSKKSVVLSDSGTSTLFEEEKIIDSTVDATEEVNTATVAESDWKEAYTLQVYELSDNEESGIAAGYLVDVDKDGIPELIAYTLFEGDMYTYSDGEIVPLGYSSAYVTEHYYQQGEQLIAVSYGMDVLSGVSISIAQKSDTELIEKTYFFNWNSEMDPIVSVAKSYYEEPIPEDYRAICNELAEQGVHVTYEYYEDENCLIYDVTIDNSQSPEYWGDLDTIIAGIREW